MGRSTVFATIRTGGLSERDINKFPHEFLEDRGKEFVLQGLLHLGQN